MISECSRGASRTIESKTRGYARPSSNAAITNGKLCSHTKSWRGVGHLRLERKLEERCAVLTQVVNESLSPGPYCCSRKATQMARLTTWSLYI